MSEQPFFLAGGIFLVVITLALVRLGWGAGGWHWAAGWCCLWGAGVANLAAQSVPAVAPLFPILGTAFAALIFSGACKFSGRQLPGWLLPAALLVAASRAALTPFVTESLTQAMGAAVIAVGSLSGAWLALTPRRPSRRNWDAVLAGSFVTLAFAAALFAHLKVTGGEAGQGLFVWMVVGVIAGGIQVVSLMGRVAHRSENQRAVLASVLDAVPVGLALVRNDGGLGAVNQTFEKIAAPAAASSSPLDFNAVIDALRSQLESGDGELLDASLARPGGASQELRFRNGMRVLSSMHPVSEGHGDGILGHLWQLTDVTEERRLQEGLERARRLETLGGFAGGVAHDFNNQLTAILGNTALLRDAIGSHEGTTEILGDLEASAQYCANLTSDVLDFARRRPGAQTPLRLEELLPGVVRRYANTLPAVTLAIAPDTPAVLADATSIARVVCNLVENARDVVEPDGRVEVRVSRSAPDRVTIEVRDDGPGMDERVRARIFDPFFTTKEVGKGTGLGLAIVYGIVASQGGEVRAESRRGHGTRMITTWPVAQATSQAPSPGA